MTLCSPPLAAGTSAPQAAPQAVPRVNRPSSITPNALKANESLADEHSFVMIDKHGDVAIRAEEETRRGTDEKTAAEGHSMDLSLKDYVVVDDYQERKEKAKLEHERKKLKMAAVEDIERRTKEEMEQRYEEELKSGVDEGGVQRINRIEAQKRRLKADGEFFMKCLKVIS